MALAKTAVHPPSRNSNGHGQRSRVCALLLAGLPWLAGLSLPLALGCRAKPSEFRIVDYDDAGRAAVYVERFDEAYYRVDERGNVDVVLRAVQPGERAGGRNHPGQPTTQIIALHSVWRSIPGRTVAASSQINGTVVYVIGDGHRWTTLGGAGSMFYTEDRKRGVLTGRLERAYLTPQERLGLSTASTTGNTGSAGPALFSRAILSGQFRALHDPQRVHQFLSETKLLSGQAAMP